MPSCSAMDSADRELSRITSSSQQETTKESSSIRPVSPNPGWWSITAETFEEEAATGVTKAYTKKEKCKETSTKPKRRKSGKKKRRKSISAEGAYKGLLSPAPEAAIPTSLSTSDHSHTETATKASSPQQPQQLPEPEPVPPLAEETEEVTSPETAASCSSSFELHASIGGHASVDAIDALFKAASKAVLNIVDEDDEASANTHRRRRTVRRRTTLCEVVQTRLETNSSLLSKSDGMSWHSVRVTIAVTSKSGDLSRATTTAENLAFAAELAIGNGEFEETVLSHQDSTSMTVHSVELAPEASDALEQGVDDDDDDDSLLELSYREYLRDPNRHLKVISDDHPDDDLASTASPSTVVAFPSVEQCAKAPHVIPLPEFLERRTCSHDRSVRFDLDIKVRETLSRHDMTLEELADYWI